MCIFRMCSQGCKDVNELHEQHSIDREREHKKEKHKQTEKEKEKSIN